MDEEPLLPPLAEGFTRLSVVILDNRRPTPGEIASLTGVALDQLGPVAVRHRLVLVDVRHAALDAARVALRRLGRVTISGFRWRWLRLAVGRNHGVSMGQLKRILQDVDAWPAGKIHIFNTHAYIGLQDFRLAPALPRLAARRINGYNPRPESVPADEGPGDPAFLPRTPSQSAAPARPRTREHPPRERCDRETPGMRPPRNP